jgi:hypothetical protein
MPKDDDDYYEGEEYIFRPLSAPLGKGEREDSYFSAGSSSEIKRLRQELSDITKRHGILDPWRKRVLKEESYNEALKDLERARKATRNRILQSLDKKLTPGGTNKLLRKLAIIVKEDKKIAKHKETR